MELLLTLFILSVTISLIAILDRLRSIRNVLRAIARKHGITYEEMRTGDDMGSRLEADM